MRRVHQLALEALQTGNIGPFPIIQNATCVDEELRTVVEDLIGDQVAHLEAPQPGWVVPLDMFDLML